MAAKKKKLPPYVVVETSSETLEALIEGACTDIADLGNECREAYDNFPNSDHPKAQAFDEAAGMLENAESPDMKEARADLLTNVHHTYEKPRDKRRQASRQVRLSNAISDLEVAIGILRRETEPGDKTFTELPLPLDVGQQEVDDARSQLADDLENLKNEAEGAEFPGMFG